MTGKTQNSLSALVRRLETTAIGSPRRSPRRSQKKNSVNVLSRRLGTTAIGSPKRNSPKRNSPKRTQANYRNLTLKRKAKKGSTTSYLAENVKDKRTHKKRKAVKSRKNLAELRRKRQAEMVKEQRLESRLRKSGIERGVVKEGRTRAQTGRIENAKMKFDE
jgi:hypothetical protein